MREVKEIVFKNYRVLLLEKDSKDWKKFNKLIRMYHYLHSLPTGGLTYKIVCECRVCGSWLALVEYRSPPIGTYMFIRKRFSSITSPRQILINTRFLVLYPHYILDRRKCHENFKGSMALAKSLSLLKLVDSEVKVVVTYVDVARGYEGKIYRAANFKELGMSAGINIKRPVAINRRVKGKWRAEKVSKKKVLYYKLR